MLNVSFAELVPI